MFSFFSFLKIPPISPNPKPITVFINMDMIKILSAKKNPENEKSI